MSNNLSISEAARLLGVQRSSLSKIIAEKKIKKEKRGRETYVSLHECQNALQELAAKGRMKVKPSTSESNDTKAMQQLIDHLREENRELKQERGKLIDKVESLISLETEVKLLRAAREEEIKSKNENLVGLVKQAIRAFR